MMIVEYCSARDEVAEFSVGSLLPLAQTAAGRAWLWAQKPAVQGDYVERIRAEGDADAMSAVPGIYRAFQELADRGYCLSLGEWTQDLHGIAVPLPPAGGREVFTLTALASEQKLKDSVFRGKVASGLLDAAARIKRELPRAEEA